MSPKQNACMPSFSTMFLLLALVLPPIAQADSEAPAWVNGDSLEDFNQETYLTAVGSGSSRREAAQDARQNLAGVFQSQIKSLTTSASESSLTESTDATVTGTGQTTSAQTVEVATDIDLDGVEVKKYFYSKEAKEHYALATLNKVEAKKRWSRKVQRQRKEVKALYKSYQKNKTVGGAQKLLTEVQQFNLENGKFAVVNDGKTLPDALRASEVEAIRAELAELRGKFAISLEYQGPQPSLEFQEMITSCLADRSVAVVVKVDKENPPPYSVIYNIREKKKFMKVKGWVKYQFSSLAVIRKGNVMVDRKRSSLTASGRDKETAFDSIKDDLSATVCKQIAQVVTT